ncbi:hypothetical protein [Hymenobacter terrestris]|uniref:DUF4288 domain-containing protein n=1 Tax=Hymenobacter terrestris TaxID=2748310 RepID=A0ABX2PZG5_9BACT|nr:hypothetical protein [Hymenobacter terrestris]NVO83709.1 hypothetical protein [Hymenobacter terrestris]
MNLFDMTIACKTTITSKETLSEIPGTWQLTDYRCLMSAAGFPDGEDVPEAEAREMSLMALADLEPAEAATVLLSYRLGDELNDGQIDQISHDMQNDKIFEEYPEIGLHRHLFDANQFLRQAYNGKFPNGEAVLVHATVQLTGPDAPEQLTAGLVLRALAPALSDRSLIKRLYAADLEDNTPFEAADNILWELTATPDSKAPGTFAVRLISSEYWLQDLADTGEFEGEIVLPEKEEA